MFLNWKKQHLDVINTKFYAFVLPSFEKLQKNLSFQNHAHLFSAYVHEIAICQHCVKKKNIGYLLAINDSH